MQDNSLSADGRLRFSSTVVDTRSALIEAIRALDLVGVLGNQSNVHELNQLL